MLLENVRKNRRFRKSHFAYIAAFSELDLLCSNQRHESLHFLIICQKSRQKSVNRAISLEFLSSFIPPTYVRVEFHHCHATVRWTCRSSKSVYVRQCFDISRHRAENVSVSLVNNSQKSEMQQNDFQIQENHSVRSGKTDGIEHKMFDTSLGMSIIDMQSLFYDKKMMCAVYK